VLKAGTNVFYANGVAGRANVVAPISLADQRRVTTGLNRQNAKKISSVVASTPDYNTKSVEAAYMAVCHPDLETDIRSMAGFKPVADYGPHTSPFEGEIGSVEQVRYLTSTVIAPWQDAGGTAGANRSTGGTNADVYPILFFGRDAFGMVPLKGKSAMTPMVVNPKPFRWRPARSAWDRGLQVLERDHHPSGSLHGTSGEHGDRITDGAFGPLPVALSKGT
jgi:N4-gp56 family major capsid protein